MTSRSPTPRSTWRPSGTSSPWLWLEQALAAEEKDGPFYDGKRQAARCFFRHELPRTGPQLDLLASLDRTTLDTDPSWL